jgi:hypothetical protein
MGIAVTDPQGVTLALILLLCRVGQTVWLCRLASLAQGLHESEDDPVARQRVVRDGLRLFSGMGSFQDLVLQDERGMRSENDELEVLRASLFEALKDRLQ